MTDVYGYDYYDSIASSWHSLSFDAIGEAIRADARLRDDNCRVLDLGCGSGVYSSFLCQTSNDYIGIDLSNEAVDLARKRGLEAVVGLAEELPFREGEMDYVFTTEVIEHVESPLDMLKEINRVLKPGGCGLLTTTTYQFTFFHYLWDLSEIDFRLRDLLGYPLGYLFKSERDRFVRLLYNCTGGHLWGFLKRDLVDLFRAADLYIDDVYYLNVQPVIPFKLESDSLLFRLARRLVEGVNGIFLHKRRFIYGPNIVILFRKGARVTSRYNG